MKIFIFILLLISSLQSLASARKRDFVYHEHLEEFFKIIATQHPSGSGNNKSITDYKNQIDPDDHVDIEEWNRLNDEDIKNMPQIDDYSDERAATQWLKWYLRILQRYQQVDGILFWIYETNITEENQNAMTAQSLKSSPFSRMSIPIAKKFNEYMKNSTNEDLKRIYGRLAQGTVSHNDEDLKQTSKLSGEMTNIYSTIKVCEPKDDKKCYTLIPYLERLMQTEKDYDRLTWAWKGWHDESGDKIRPLYLPYVDLLTKNIKENGYSDVAESWIQEYEMGNTTEFESIMDQILKDIMPLYKQLHAYVRGRLCSIYPNRFKCNGPIPAHILGNMWAQQWDSRLEDVIPYPNATLVNITEKLHKNHYSVHKMYTTAEDFFTSIGLYPMTPKFWAYSLFKKPKDRQADCYASAFDLGYHDDYRVKICTQINNNYFYVVHHEMGHIEYFMSYGKKQPFVYRDGANSGFHEAIGDTIGMYAVSSTHLLKLGFLKEEEITPDYEINFLMRLALQKVAFLPFGYIMDKYRFQLFRNQINRQYELNSMWWALRVEHGGIMAAVPRSDATNFDAGAKFHVPANVPYFRYFIANILQFQFYRAMCRLQGETKRLHMCDIYGNKDVGERFKQMLEMGNSKPWAEILESFTGENKLEPQAMLDFFEPLHNWLKKENAAKGYPVGWM